MATLEQLNDRVENKELTLEQAQEQARIYLSGPKNDNGKGYQFQKSDFIYKNKGYLVAYGADYSSQVHPVNDIGVIPDNTTNRQKWSLAPQQKAKMHTISPIWIKTMPRGRKAKTRLYEPVYTVELEYRNRRISG
ncbi:cache domain-containing protein [Bacillus sp. B6(2022)]|nr:cache domain-containing protein [Bacillus sp. B6(2022)]